MKFEEKASAWMREQKLFTPHDTVIVGLSGGADSVCLLVLLQELSEELCITLRAVHVHHGLRGEEADRDERFSEALCARLGVPYNCVHVDVRDYAKTHALSVEEAARLLRYGALDKERERAGAQRIAVAHHADDQVETVLYHLFRGTGLHGLAGMRPVRDHIVRPLLFAGREEILSWLTERGIPHCEDSTNECTDYTRNKLRHVIIPLIKQEVNPQASAHILQVAEMAGEADEAFKQAAEALFCKEAGWEEAHGLFTVSVPAAALIKETDLLQTYVIRRMIGELAETSKDITSAHVEAVKELLHKGVGKRVSLPYGLEACRDYGLLKIGRGQEEAFSGEEEGKELPRPVFLTFPFKKEQEIPKNGYTKWFDYDKIKHAPTVRYRKSGDYITLAGGGRKSVKSYMIDEKIPQKERDLIPLIADGSHILWIVGYRISEYYKVTEETETVLQIQVKDPAACRRINGGKDDG